MEKRYIGLAMLADSAILMTIIVLAVRGVGWPGVWLQTDPGGWKAPLVIAAFALLIWLGASGANLYLRGLFVSAKWLAALLCLAVAYWFLPFCNESSIVSLSRLLLTPVILMLYNRSALTKNRWFFPLAALAYIIWSPASIWFMYNFYIPYQLELAVQLGIVILGNLSVLLIWSIVCKERFQRGIVWVITGIGLEVSLSIFLILYLYFILSTNVFGILLLVAAVYIFYLAWSRKVPWAGLVKIIAAGTAGVLLAVAIFSAWSVPVPAATSLDLEVQEAALRHMITRSARERPAFIALDDWKSDVSSDTLRRLADLPVPVLGVSRARFISSVRDSITHRQGVIYHVGIVEWQEDGGAKVSIGSVCANLCGYSYVYFLAKTHSGWKVVEEKLVGMS